MRKGKVLILFLILSASLMTFQLTNVKAATLYVDQSGLCIGAFPDVQTALIAASPGDTIVFCSNIYETVSRVDINLDVVINGNGFNWFVEDLDVTDETISISGSARVLFHDINITLFGTGPGLYRQGIRIYSGATLNMSRINLTIYLEQSSRNTYGVFYDDSTLGYILESKILTLGGPSISGSGVIVLNSNIWILDSILQAVHNGVAWYVIGNSLGNTINIINSLIRSSYGDGIYLISATAPVTAGQTLIIKYSVLSGYVNSIFAGADQGSSVILNITKSKLYSNSYGIQVAGGGPFSSLASFLTLILRDVDIIVYSNTPYQIGIGIYGRSGVA